MKEDALFCVGQKAFIERDGKVLVLNDPVEGLDFPGGKIQEGEAKDGDAPSDRIDTLYLAMARHEVLTIKKILRCMKGAQ